MTDNERKLVREATKRCRKCLYYECRGGEYCFYWNDYLSPYVAFCSHFIERKEESK